eukprot:Ihof_evm8s290 gene=Ihof_evmTU8s290
MSAEVPMPTRFRFGSTGPDYMLAVEVAKYFNKPANMLSKQYPSMFRRAATLAERMILKASNITHNIHITLVRANEVDKIAEGNDAELKVAPEPLATETPIGISIQPPERDNGAFNAPATGLVLDSPEAFMQGNMYRRQKLKMPNNPFSTEIREGGQEDSKVIKQRSEDEMLVPISIDLEENGYRVRENFVWNYNEPKITVEQFSQLVCDDLEVPKSMAILIMNSIKEQLNDFSAYNFTWETAEEHRIPISLRIFVGNTQLQDQFEWDINSTDTSPEVFASRLCADLALGGEYVSTVAHSIREQLLIYHKNMAETHIGDQLGPITYPPLRSAKDEAWGPTLEAVSEQDIEQFQKQKDRVM